jgi:hypothetical protein
MAGVKVDLEMDFSALLKGFEGNPDELMEQIKTKTAKRSILKMRRVAVDMVHVDTGRLRQSLEQTKAQFIDQTGETTIEYGIGTNVEYAVPEEYGVGPLGDPDVPHTPKTAWVYYNKEKGRFVTARTRPAHPYLRPALEFNRKNFERYLKEAIEEAQKESFT